jgi:hypothetical protein
MLLQCFLWMFVTVCNSLDFAQIGVLKLRDDAEGHFGTSLSILGDTIVVGAPDASDDEFGNPGAAYVYVLDGSKWIRQAILKASNPGSGDKFGCSVSISGDTIVVGAPYEDSSATGVNGDGDDDNASGSGAVYVFVRNETKPVMLKLMTTLAIQ